ncbi:MAG: N-acetyltransferase family protein [Candidatus Nanopelagicales bacterium]
MSDPTPLADASVRDARAEDALAIGSVMVASWKQLYADVLPAQTLQSLTPLAVADDWKRSITSPPTPRHKVLVALEGPALVGYAVAAPAGDAGETAGAVGEVVDLVIHPDSTRHGHGSRLLNASVDHLRAHGYTEVVTWCGERDRLRSRFLESAGFADDGRRRRMDSGPGTPAVVQVRYSAALD